MMHDSYILCMNYTFLYRNKSSCTQKKSSSTQKKSSYTQKLDEFTHNKKKKFFRLCATTFFLCARRVDPIHVLLKIKT